MSNLHGLRGFTALLLTAPLATAQGESVVVFHGAPADFGVIEQRTVPLPAGSTFPFAPLAVRLLPVESNGRTELARWSDSIAWRHDDVPGANRISLPGGLGSLYRYEVDLGAGARAFGFLRIAVDGALSRLIELPGAGPVGADDPFHGRVSVSVDGRAFLCATRAAAGGDLYEVDTVNATAIARSSNQAPLDFRPESLALAPRMGVAVHAQGVVRFARRPGGQAQAVDLAGLAPTDFPGDVALANSGRYAAVVAGSDAQHRDVFVFGTRGAAVKVTPQPAEISSAGFLPEDLDGPYLAVADDGSQCAWRIEGAAREVFLAAVPWTQPSVAHQLSADANFIDTIDEVAQFAFRPGGVLRFSAGERAGAFGGIDKLDVFAATPGAVSPQITNLSRSSGVIVPPFVVPGEIEADGAFDLPAAQGRLLLDDDQEELLLLPETGAAPLVVLTQVKAFEDAVRDGDDYLLMIRRTNGSQPRQALHWSPNSPLSFTLLFSSSAADRLAPASLRGSHWSLVEERLTSRQLIAGSLGVAGASTLPVVDWDFGTTLAITSSGQVVMRAGPSGGNSAFVRWNPSLPLRRWGNSFVQGFVLRGG